MEKIHRTFLHEVYPFLLQYIVHSTLQVSIGLIYTLKYVNELSYFVKFITL